MKTSSFTARCGFRSCPIEISQVMLCRFVCVFAVYSIEVCVRKKPVKRVRFSVLPTKMFSRWVYTGWCAVLRYNVCVQVLPVFHGCWMLRTVEDTTLRFCRCSKYVFLSLLTSSDLFFLKFWWVWRNAFSLVVVVTVVEKNACESGHGTHVWASEGNGIIPKSSLTQ